MDRVFFAVVPAAGAGTRMGLGGSSKVLLPLGASSVLELTLNLLISTGLFRGVAVAIRQKDEAGIDAVISRVSKECGGGLEFLKVWGGETRQISVYNCLKALKDRADFVAVHDAARPLCLCEEIRQGARTCLETKAAILACPVSSTVKRADPDGNIAETLPRTGLWLAQTPQFFSYSLLREAHERACADGYIGTDESELVERIGAKVSLVRASENNIKITTPADLELAVAIVGARRAVLD